MYMYMYLELSCISEVPDTLRQHSQFTTWYYLIYPAREQSSKFILHHKNLVCACAPRLFVLLEKEAPAILRELNSGVKMSRKDPLSILPSMRKSSSRVREWIHSLSNRESAPGGRKTPSHRGNGESEDTVSAPRTSRKEPETNQSGEENPATEDAGLAEAQGGGEGLPASQGGSQIAKQGLTASQGGPSQTTSRASRGLGDGRTGGDGGPGSSGSDEEADDEASLSSTAHKQKRRGKRPRSSDSDRTSTSRSKKTKAGSATDSEEEDSSLPCFDPASLVEAKEGTFKAPLEMKRYLNKHMKRCLSKEEREALYKEHPRPDLVSCTPPKVDKYMADFLGKRLPKEHDSELAKIQASVLATMRPLTSAWQHLSDGGLKDEPDLLVPGAEVMSLVQRTLCMLGNASELISQTRRSKILEAVDPSWGKYGSDEFPSAKETLFGENFQSALTKRVEKDVALSKAVAITKKSKKEESSPSFRNREQKKGPFFRGGPPAKYGGRQGRSFFPYHSMATNRQGEFNQPRQHQAPQKQGHKPLFHEPRLPWKAQQKRF